MIGFEEYSGSMYPQTWVVINDLKNRFDLTYSGCVDRWECRYRLGQFIKPTLRPGRLWNRLVNLPSVLKKFRVVKLQIQNLCAKEYDAIIAIDEAALAYAIRHNILKQPIILWSHDILTPDQPWCESLFTQRMLRYLRCNINMCRLFIVQDHYKGALLDSVLLTKSVEHFYLPVSLPDNEFSLAQRAIRKEKRKLEHKVRLMHLGTIDTTRGSDQVLVAYQNIQKGVELVLQGYVTQRIKALIETLARKPVVSPKYATIEDYQAAFASVDIGIMTNISLVINNYFCSMASGQLAEYTRMGIPVIVLFAEELGTFVEREQCGIYLRGTEGLPDAVAKLAGNYAFYSCNSSSVYDKYLNYELYRQPLAEKIEEIVNSGRQQS